MTTIAWDGNTLAADKRAVNGTSHSTVTKIRKIKGELCGGGGQFSSVLEMFEWINKGKKPEEFPKSQLDDDKWAPILVITKTNKILKYEQSPIPIEYEDGMQAIGSGRDYALAAMHLGKNAKEAIEVASKFDPHTGNGVDTLSF